MTSDRQADVQLRILMKESWTTGSWVEQAYAGDGGVNGFQVVNMSRTCLPGVGQAQLVYRCGWMPISGRGGVASIEIAPDRYGYEVRIQAKPRSPVGNYSWKTIWWGQVVREVDRIYGPAAHRDGSRIYHCVDGLARYQRRVLSRHWWYVYQDTGEGSGESGAGHPGYNCGGAVLGDHADQTVDGHQAHTWPGDPYASPWTDLEVIESILETSSTTDDPSWTVAGSTALDLFGDVHSWQYREGMSAWDLIAQVCSRKRGRGIVLVSWEDDEKNPYADLRPQILFRPQTYNDVTYLLPSTNAQVTIQGAVSTGTHVSLDLTDDLRCHQPIALARRGNVVDYVDVVGEKIQVVVTMSGFDDTLTPGWGPSDEDGYDGDVYDPEYYHVYTRFTIPPKFTGLVKDGIGGAATRCDYRCDGYVDGYNGTAIVQPSGEDDTAPWQFRILRDMPIYQGPSPEWHSTEGARIPPLLFSKLVISEGTTDETFAVGEPPHPTQVGRSEIRCYDAASRSNGEVRQWSNGHEALTLTCALELSWRVRCGYGDQSSESRRSINVPGAHLWLAHPGAFVKIDEDLKGVRSLGEQSGNANDNQDVGILRDDRDQLAAIAALAGEWYVETHRPIKIDVLGCPFVTNQGGWAGGGLEGWPLLGYVLHGLTAGGDYYVIDTPVTAIRYDPKSASGQIETSWVELDLT